MLLPQVSTSQGSLSSADVKGYAGIGGVAGAVVTQVNSSSIGSVAASMAGDAEAPEDAPDNSSESSDEVQAPLAKALKVADGDKKAAKPA